MAKKKQLYQKIGKRVPASAMPEDLCKIVSGKTGLGVRRSGDACRGSEDRRQVGGQDDGNQEGEGEQYAQPGQ